MNNFKRLENEKNIFFILALFLVGFLFIQFYKFNYFDFDEVVNYKNEITEEEIGELYDNKSKSELDSLKMEVILENIPNSINNTTFIDRLENIGYKKSTINQAKFNEINKLFSYKLQFTFVSSGCIYVYRDVLIL